MLPFRIATVEHVSRGKSRVVEHFAPKMVPGTVLFCWKTRKKSALPTPSALVERKFVLASLLAIRRVFLPPPDRQSVELVEEVVLLVVILETDVTDIISTPKSGGDFWQCCHHRSLERALLYDTCWLLIFGVFFFFFFF